MQDKINTKSLICLSTPKKPHTVKTGSDRREELPSAQIPNVADIYLSI